MEETIYKELIRNRINYKYAGLIDNVGVFKILIKAKKIRFISRTSSIEKMRGSNDTFFIVCEYQKYATDMFKDFISFCFDNNINIKATFKSLTIEVIWKYH